MDYRCGKSFEHISRVVSPNERGYRSIGSRKMYTVFLDIVAGFTNSTLTAAPWMSTTTYLCEFEANVRRYTCLFVINACTWDSE